MSKINWQKLGYDDLVRNFFAKRPKDVDGVANTSAMYYQTWILKKVFARFEFSGVPAGWDIDYMLEALFLDGYFIITDTELGVIPLKCGLTGINVFNHPTEAIIANPVLGGFRRVIDEDCALVKLQYDFNGIRDMVNRYSALLAMCDSSIAVNLMNSKVAFIGMAGSKAQAATMQSMYDQISCGNPAVFVNEDSVNPASFFFNHVKENYIADQVQLTKRKIIDEFLTEIGINNANTDKKERLVTDEVAANNQEVMCNIEHWLSNITEGLEQANRLFNLNLSVEIKKFEGGGSSESTEPSNIQSE